MDEHAVNNVLTQASDEVSDLSDPDKLWEANPEKVSVLCPEEGDANLLRVFAPPQAGLWEGYSQFTYHTWKESLMAIKAFAETYPDISFGFNVYVAQSPGPDPAFPPTHGEDGRSLTGQCFWGVVW